MPHHSIPGRLLASPRRLAAVLLCGAALAVGTPAPVVAGGGDFIGGVAVGVIGAAIVHGIANQHHSHRVVVRAPRESAETSAIRRDQAALAVLGFYGGPTDGKRTPAYESAVVQYKLSKGVIATAILSETERALLQGEASQREVLAAIGDPDTDPLVVPRPDYRAQVALRELAFYDGGLDGKRGKKLIAAISQWQRGAGQVPTGVLSVDQTRSLMDEVSTQAQSRIAAIDQQYAAMAQTARPQVAPAPTAAPAPQPVAAAPAPAPAVQPAPMLAAVQAAAQPTPPPAVAQPASPPAAVAPPASEARSSWAPIEPLKPVNPAPRPWDVAVVIGNQAYRNGLPEVSYGVRDAEAIRAVLVNRLGFSPDNVILVENATQGDMASVFGNRDSFKGKLWKYIDPDGRSEVFVFYSGLGIPDVATRTPYLLPVDADPSTVTINGYPLELLYGNLGRLGIRRANVFLDASFSGASNARPLVAAASPPFVSARVESVPGADRLTVFAAADGDQPAGRDDTSGHGLFTRFVLDGLSGGVAPGEDGRITAAQLQGHLLENVRRQARRTWGREQTPVLIGDATVEIAHR